MLITLYKLSTFMGRLLFGYDSGSDNLDMDQMRNNQEIGVTHDDSRMTVMAVTRHVFWE